VRILKNLLRFLVTGSFSFIIAACYGVPVGYGDVETRLRVVNKDSEPVSGLRVYPGIDYSQEYYTTDENGEAVFFPIVDTEAGGLVSPIIRDVDGEDNLGCFARTEVALGEEAALNVVIAANEYRYSETEKTCRFLTENGEPIPGLKVSLGFSGCNLDEFITDDRGEVVFHPLINSNGVMQNISVGDEDGTNTYGYFGKVWDIALVDDREMEVVLAAEAPPAEPVEQVESEESGAQDETDENNPE